MQLHWGNKVKAEFLIKDAERDNLLDTAKKVSQ